VAFVVADRVKETSTTTGTGNFTLAGAEDGFRAFSAAIGTSNSTFYCISLQGGTEYEVGVGTLTGSTTFQRDAVLTSSNSNNLVNFSAGTKDVFCTQPAEQPHDATMVASIALG
jgi:hypothetical protein